MKTYTLKLKTTSTTNYNLYVGTTLVGDTALSTLFATAGSAYFVFDFNSLTPANTTSITILDSNGTAVITNTGLSGIAENKNFKGTWSASATAFDSFALLGGVAMDEAQLSKLIALARTGAGNPVFYDLTTGADLARNTALINDFNAGKLCYVNCGQVPKWWTLVNCNNNSGFIMAMNRQSIGMGNQIRSRMVSFNPTSGAVTFSNIEDRKVPFVSDSLASTSSEDALSANQGRILNNKIEGRILNGGTTAPTTSTVGAIGTQYACVNNGTPEVYVCTDTTGGTYTWTKIY